MLDGARTVDEIVARVYPDLSESLRDAAADSVRAHLIKLRDDGRERQ
jgi:beta-lactamase-like protein